MNGILAVTVIGFALVEAQISTTENEGTTMRPLEPYPKAPYFELAKPLESRPSCVLGPHHMLNRFNSTTLLSGLRARMSAAGLNGYIVSAEDVHKSDVTPDYMRRLRFVSGFTGDTGTAVISQSQAAIWVEGRYLSQAEEEVDCNWHVINGGSPDAPTVDEWIKSAVDGRNRRIGVDARIIAFREFQRLEQSLNPLGIELVASSRNLVDELWTATGSRPKEQNGSIVTHSIEFAGESWQDKVRRLRDFLKKSGIDAIFITDLKEIAWLYNLRGSDIPFSPLFEAFVYLHHDEQRLFVNGRKLSSQVRDYLIMDECNNWACVQWRDYNQVYSELIMLSKRDTRLMVSSQCSYALCGSVDQSRLVVSDAPIRSMMTIKNNIEIKGMRSANLKDSAAIVSMLSHLEHDVLERRKTWNERRAIEHLNDIRRRQDMYRGESFPSVSASGTHSSIPHYQAKRFSSRHRKSALERKFHTVASTRYEYAGNLTGMSVPNERTSMNKSSHFGTNSHILPDQIYLLSTGAHYLDGSTEITRTIHLGQPTDFQKEVYTRVLMGHIDLFLTTFPYGIRDHLIDSIARRYLWQIGLDYQHGTGHGVGCYLYVRETPPNVSPVSRGHPLLPGNILTNEPSYYEVDQFGVKLETSMLVVAVNATKDNLPHANRYCRFEPLTYVPFDTKLINIELMTPVQVRWLNDYHAKCMDFLRLQLRESKDILEWLERKTTSLQHGCSGNSVVSAQRSPSVTITSSTSFMWVMVFIVLSLTKNI